MFFSVVQCSAYFTSTDILKCGKNIVQIGVIIINRSIVDEQTIADDDDDVADECSE